jgi:hypothetical protein
MDPIYQSAINGTLKSPASGQKMTNINFTNSLAVPIYIHIVNTEGVLKPSDLLAPQERIVLPECFANWYIVFTVAASGAFVCVIQLVATQLNYVVAPDLLVQPNDIGTFPRPSGTIIIPPDSPRILVGCGKAANGNPLTREQYWKRNSDSYALAPNERRTVGYTSTSGMQTTTSSEQEIATSLGMNASVGWGPISASVSASLSTSARSLQQVAVTTETTRYETIELANPSESPQMFLKWQLTDVLTVFNKELMSQPLAAIVQVAQPVLIAGPYLFNPLGEELLSRQQLDVPMSQL